MKNGDKRNKNSKTCQPILTKVLQLKGSFMVKKIRIKRHEKSKTYQHYTNHGPTGVKSKAFCNLLKPRGIINQTIVSL